MNKLTKVFCAVAAACCALFMSSCSQNALLLPHQTEPSYVAVEMFSGRVLYSQNANVRRPIGMLANVATAVVVHDWMKSQGVSLNKMVTVPAAATKWARTNLLKLQPGDTISLRDALYATLMLDDSACATTLAYACGSSLNSSNPESAFVNQMNLMAKRLGMNSTYFKGSNGAVITQSSARDMALLAMYAISDEDGQLLAISGCRTATVTVNSAGGSRAQVIYNTNKLLGSSEQVDGLKAGTSRTAGSCLIVTSRRSSVKLTNPSTGQPATYAQRMIVVMLGMPNSSARYSTAAQFLRDGWSAWEQWLPTQDMKDPSQFITLPN